MTLAYSPDGRSVASTTGINESEPAEVALWDPVTAREAARVPGISRRVVRLAFSHDGRTLAVCDWQCDEANRIEGRVNLWGVSPGHTLTTTKPLSFASAFLAVSPDHRLLATSTESGQVTLRDATTGEAIRTLPGPFCPVNGIGFTPDGRLGLFQSNLMWRFFDPLTGSEAGENLSTFGEGTSMTLDGNYFHWLQRKHIMDFYVTDTRSDPRPTILEGVTGDSLHFVLSPDKRTLAGAGHLLCATLWDVSSGTKRAEYPLPARDAGALVFTSRGESLIFGCGDAKIRSWHIEKPPEPLDHLSGHAKEVWALAYTPDGKTLASASDDHTIKLWDTRSGALRGTLTGHLSLVSSLAVSPNGKTLASGAFDSTVRLWDLPSGRLRAVLSGHADRVRGVAFSPDGRFLASCASDFTVRLWDAANGRELRILQGHIDGLHDLAFDRNGTRLVSACNDGSLRIWDLAGDREPHTIPGPVANMALAFSRDGTLLASGTDRGNLAIWDSTTWDRRIAIKGSDAAIRNLAFSPDGRTLAAACDDAKVRLWDPVTGQLTLVLDGHKKRVNAVVFSPDGSTLASASHDGAIKLWHAERP